MNDLVAQAERKVGFETLYQKSLKAVEETDDLENLIEMEAQVEALRTYSRKVVEESEYARKFSEVKVRTQRKMGTVLKMAIKQGNPQLSHDATFAKLEDLGLTKSDSSRFQKIAALPEWVFEHHIESMYTVTTNSALRMAKKYMLFKSLVKDLPTKERVALLKQGILGNMPEETFTRMFAPTPATDTPQKKKKTKAKRPKTFSISNNIQDFYDNAVGFMDYLKQLEGWVVHSRAKIESFDVDLYVKGMVMYDEAFEFMKEVAKKMKGRVVNDV